MSFFIIKKQLEKKIEIEHKLGISLRTDLTNLAIDFYLPLFSYTTKNQKDLMPLFQKLQKTCLQFQEVEEVFFSKGFLNIKVKRLVLLTNILYKICQADRQYGSQKTQNKTVILDYSSPNIAKNFSIGHLRSTVIGNALKNIYQKLGFQTISINHLGDWGTQFGKMILAYQKWGDIQKIQVDPLNELQKLYILFHQKAQLDPSLNQQASLIFRRLEKQDDELIDLWKQIKQLSLNEFKNIYNLLGITFDYYTGESFYNNYVTDVIAELKKKKLLKLDNQAYIVPLDKLPPALIQKTNCSTLYLTRDLAALLYRFRQYKCHYILYVVGNEQKLHFLQLQQVVVKMGYLWSIKHINFGLILIKGKKLSSRSEQFIRLKDVIYQMEELAQKILKDKHTSLLNLNLQNLARKIAIGSLIFNDLKNDRQLDIIFDWEKILQLEGQTGPYLQYTLVRINSLLKKLNLVINFIEKNFQQLEIESLVYLQNHYLILIKLLDQFPTILKKTQIYNSPSILARYLLQLAKNFNSFYVKERIIVSDIKRQNTNFLLIKSIFIVLKEGLNLLSIPYLEKM